MRKKASNKRNSKMRKKIKRYNPVNTLNIATNIRGDLSETHRILMHFFISSS